MIHVLSTILLTASFNVDNLGVGLAYGVWGRRIRLHDNLLIALVSGSGTFASMATGEWINDYMSEEFANVLGATILMLFGLYTIIWALRRNRSDSVGIAPALRGQSSGTETNTREGMALAISLTINNLGGGVGAGISHLNIPLTTVFTMMASMMAIAIGYRLGQRASFRASELKLGVTSGLLLFGLGVLEYFV